MRIFGQSELREVIARLEFLQEDTVTWFWIGSHDQYEEFFG